MAYDIHFWLDELQSITGYKNTKPRLLPPLVVDTNVEFRVFLYSGKNAERRVDVSPFSFWSSIDVPNPKPSTGFVHLGNSNNSARPFSVNSLASEVQEVINSHGLFNGGCTVEGGPGNWIITANASGSQLALTGQVSGSGTENVLKITEFSAGTSIANASYRVQVIQVPAIVNDEWTQDQGDADIELNIIQAGGAGADCIFDLTETEDTVSGFFNLSINAHNFTFQHGITPSAMQLEIKSALTSTSSVFVSQSQSGGYLVKLGGAATATTAPTITVNGDLLQAQSYFKTTSNITGEGLVEIFKNLNAATSGFEVRLVQDGIESTAIFPVVLKMPVTREEVEPIPAGILDSMWLYNPYARLWHKVTGAESSGNPILDIDAGVPSPPLGWTNPHLVKSEFDEIYTLHVRPGLAVEFAYFGTAFLSLPSALYLRLDADHAILIEVVESPGNETLQLTIVDIDTL